MDSISVEKLDSYRETNGILEHKKALKRLSKILEHNIIQEAERGMPRNIEREEKLRLIQRETEKY